MVWIVCFVVFSVFMMVIGLKCCWLYFCVVMVIEIVVSIMVSRLVSKKYCFVCVIEWLIVDLLLVIVC